MSVKITVNEASVLHEVKARCQDGLRKVGPEILRTAIQKCPVDTGNLQRSIEPVYEPLRLTIGSQVHYAGYVEGGTSKMAAQPYLRPALIANLRRVKKIFKAI